MTWLLMLPTEKLASALEDHATETHAEIAVFNPNAPPAEPDEMPEVPRRPPTMWSPAQSETMR